MKKTINAIIIMVFAGGLLSGCGGKIFNPYEDSFSCPEISDGKCISMPNAYEESINGPKKQPTGDKKGKNGNGEQATVTPDIFKDRTSTESQYKEMKFAKMKALIGESPTPIVVPPDVVRILILPYTGDENEMFSYRYLYFFATKPSWIMPTGAATPSF